MAAGALPCSAVKLPVLPPGLEDSLSPAKICLAGTAGWAPDARGAVPFYVPHCGSQGEWVSAIMATAPFLDANGLQEALHILDCAIANVQQAKALECILVSGGPQAAAAEVLRAQVFERQQVLLYQLHCLGDAASLAPGAGDALVVAPGDSCDASVDRVLGALGHPVQPRKPVQGQPREERSPRPQQRWAPPPQEVVQRHLLHVQLLQLPHEDAAIAAAPLQSAEPRGSNAKARRSTGDCAPAVRGSSRQVQTLSTSLQLLASEDPDCLFIVRRINKLGFKACRKLKQHFATYGTVVRVLVAHSTVRQHGDPQSHTRRRPSSLGFVHMADAEAVRQVLAQGTEQEVEGSFIRVQRFERQPGDSQEEEDEEDGDEAARVLEEEAKSGDKVCQPSLGDHDLKDWDRQQSGFSTASTRTASTAASVEESEAASPAAHGGE